MKKIHPFLIVEDQEIIAENLRRIIVQLGYQNPLVATSYNKAVQFIEEENISLLILDIVLEKDLKDGIDLITEVKHKCIPHIFVTANADKSTLDRAKLTKPLGYIVKPFEKETIFSTLEIALYTISENNNEPQKIKYIDKGQKKFIGVETIFYLKADGVYIDVENEEGKKVLVRNTFKNINTQLPHYFVQIHKSIMVNCKKITSFSSTKVIVNNEELIIGRSYKKEFLTQMENL